MSGGSERSYLIAWRSTFQVLAASSQSSCLDCRARSSSCSLALTAKASSRKVHLRLTVERGDWLSTDPFWNSSKVTNHCFCNLGFEVRAVAAPHDYSAFGNRYVRGKYWPVVKCYPTVLWSLRSTSHDRKCNLKSSSRTTSCFDVAP